MNPTTPDQQTDINDALFAAALQTLNDAYTADPGALHALICNRVPCNTALGAHGPFNTGLASRLLNQARVRST